MPSLAKCRPQPRHGRQIEQASRSARFRAALSERRAPARLRAAVLELAAIVAFCQVRSSCIQRQTPAVAAPRYSKCPGTISPSTMVGGTYF